MLGLVLAAHEFGPAPLAVVALLGTGFCGGFTTFSAFVETVRLAEQGATFAAALNIVSSVGVGLLAAGVVGWSAGQAVLGVDAYAAGTLVDRRRSGPPRSPCGRSCDSRSARAACCWAIRSFSRELLLDVWLALRAGVLAGLRKRLAR